MTARYLVGDVFDRLAEIEDGSVDLVVTSPPFLALRSYLPADHPDKANEIGQEQSPAEFIEVLLRVTGEIRRVLAPHGSLCVELGDTNAGSGGAGGDYQEQGLRDGQPVWDGSARRNAGADRKNPGNTSQGTARKRSRPASLSAVANEDAAPPARLRTRRHLPGWPRHKSRCMIPESYRWALAYGVNPFTGDDSPAGEWIARQTITWCRPNPTPGYIGDRWRYGTSDIVVACTSPRPYWDDLATRREYPRVNKFSRTRAQMNRGAPGYHTGDDDRNVEQNPAGAPLLDWWVLPSTGYPGAHYAVYPPGIVEPLVRAMCPERVCRTCGEPSRRIVANVAETGGKYQGVRIPGTGDRGGSVFPLAEIVTLGWTDCGHDDWRRGVVLDPFAGTGTTLHVAEALERDAIGIDLDERNVALYEARADEPAFMRLRQGTLL